MEIVCCDAASEAAQKAFRLRYRVYGHEMGVFDPSIDHENGIYVDELDKHSRIYVALKDGEAIATVRALYDRDFDFSRALPESITNMLGIDIFLKNYPGALAISTRFAISPDHRGSLAANLVTAKMFRDFLDDGINFVFSWCAPYLFNFYSQLGFHMYSRSISDRNGLWTPIVLLTQDWEHLQHMKSPLLKQLDKTRFAEPQHSSVKWFRENFGAQLESFVASYDDHVVEKIFLFSGDSASKSENQGIGIFDSMAAEDVKKIIGTGKLLRLSAGQVVIQRGHITDEMFIVVEGEIKVSLKGADFLCFKIGPGEAFGEISMLSRTSRTADCIAVTDTQVAIISRQNLLRLIKVEPELSTQLLFNLARSLSFKLWRTNEYITTRQKLSYWPSLILEIRMRLNLCQESFAELLDSSEEAISRWEMGVETPSRQKQKMLERLASDKNITSLGGLAELVRNSPSRMFIIDEDYFVLAASKSSEWIESANVENQLTNRAIPSFRVVSEKLRESGFWNRAAGELLGYDFNLHGNLWRSVITSVSIRDRIYAVVQQTIS